MGLAASRGRPGGPSHRRVGGLACSSGPPTGGGLESGAPLTALFAFQEALAGFLVHCWLRSGPARQGFPFGRPAAGLDRPPRAGCWSGVRHVGAGPVVRQALRRRRLAAAWPCGGVVRQSGGGGHAGWPVWGRVLVVGRPRGGALADHRFLL